MVLGDLEAWAKRFISTDERLLERIAFVWPTCLAVLPAQPEEDKITINLVDLLSKDPVVRSICHYVEYQFEPFGTTPDGLKFSKGRIDVAVLLDWEREQYIAYECKRLNIVPARGRSSLAKVYVTHGMMRFMTEQYAERLPVGCMLGYVLDGDMPFAIKQLRRAIRAHRPLNITKNPARAAVIQNIERFVTRHNRAGSTTIELRHALLAFPKAVQRQRQNA